MESNVAWCPPGQRATGGGVSSPVERDDAVVVESRPAPAGAPAPIGWFGTVRFTVTQSPSAINSPVVWVICTGP